MKMIKYTEQNLLVHLKRAVKTLFVDILKQEVEQEVIGQ